MRLSMSYRTPLRSLELIPLSSGRSHKHEKWWRNAAMWDVFKHKILILINKL